MKKIIQKSKLGITDENVSVILAESCLLTQLKVKGKKGNLSLERYLNINPRPACVIAGKPYADMTDEEKAAVEAYKVGQKIRTQMSFLPKNILTSITTKQSNLRRDYYEACSAPNYMTITNYSNFKKQIDATAKEIEKELEKVELDWDSYLDKFKTDLKTKFPSLKDSEIEALIRTLGTGEEFKNSYSINLEYVPVPNVYSAKGMNASYMAEATQNCNKNAEENIELMVGNALNTLFQKCNLVLKSAASLKKMGARTMVAPKTKGSIMNAGVELDAKIGFLKIGEIEDFVTKANDMTKLKDEDLIDAAEMMCGEIYLFMKDMDLYEFLDLSESVLSESVLSVYAKTI